MDRAHLEENLARARKLASDPLQQMLVFIGLYEEEFDALEVLRESTLMWREAMLRMLEEIARHLRTYLELLFAPTPPAPSSGTAS